VARLLERLEEVKGKAQERLRNDRESLLLSLELVTIRRDVALDPGLEAIGPARPDAKALAHVFGKLGFQSLLKKVAEGTRASEPRDYRVVKSAAELEAMIDELRAAGAFAVDTETTGLFPLQAELVGVSFSARPLRAYYVPFNLEPPLLPGGRAALLAALAPLLTSPECVRVGRTPSSTGSCSDTRASSCRRPTSTRWSRATAARARRAATASTTWR
jgi:DNA polymerase-1